MPSFIATFTNTRGQQRQLQLTAANLLVAKRNLRRRGIRPISLEPAPGGGSSAGAAAIAQPGMTRSAGNATPPGSQQKPANRGGSGLGNLLQARPGIREKALFANKLSAMVTAGVPIVRSLTLLSSQQKIPLFKQALEAISSEVNQGNSLGSALRQWPEIFDRLSIAMVEAGEAGGVLDETLKRLAKVQEDNAKLQNQIKSALGYPVTVLVIAILVFLGMTIFVIPTFAGVFKDLGADLPAFTQLMLNLSSLLRSVFSLFLAAFIALGVWLFSRYYQSAQGRRRVDGLMLRLPLFGELLTKSATAQFCRTFSSLSRAGVPILSTLDILRETTDNSVISDAIAYSRTEVLEGIPLSIALSRKQVFPEMAVSMLVIGEETGGLDVMLSKVADFYEDEVTTTVKSITSMIEPAMIVFVGGIVGSILLAMYLPMFSIYQKIR